MSEDYDDIESKVRELLRDHLGVDIVFAMCYTTAEGKQPCYILQQGGDVVKCRRLVDMLRAACADDSEQPESDAYYVEDEDTE